MNFINEEIWQKHIKGWLITGCAIRSKDVIYLCMRQDILEEKMVSMWDSEIPSRLAIIFPHREDIQYSHQGVSGFNKPRVGVALVPKEQGLLSSNTHGGIVCVVGSGSNWPMEYIHKDEWASTQKIKCIDSYAYSVGWGRRVYKRVDIGHWLPLTNGFPEGTSGTERGFEDLDGFSEQDMYAVGGSGDIWHYDGQIWTPCAFPSNEQLSAVVCAPDGQVYIGGEGGSLWVGRQHTWQCVYRGYSTVLWNEMRWFQNQLWLCSDYQCEIWNGTTLEHPTHKGSMKVLSGHMDARDGILVVADLHSVDLFDGSEWHSIVRPY